MFKKTLAMDFDGVIHAYRNGWKGDDVIYDEPVKGVKEFIEKMRAKNYHVVIFSSRANTLNGYLAIQQWLIEYGIVVDDVAREKPAAHVTIDDRAICFEGSFEGMEEKVDTFTPWMKKVK